MKRFDKHKTQSIIKLLDAAAKKYGLQDTRHAANCWTSGQRDRIRLEKQSIALNRQLAEVNKRLGK